MDQHDVYRALQDLLRSGAYSIGSRLPSCRALAAEIGSNPNTVHRALKTLQDEGHLRSVSRKGTFVTGIPSGNAHAEWLDREVSQLVSRALASGVDLPTLRRMIDEAFIQAEMPATLLFVECNEKDVREMAQAVEQASGLSFTRLLLTDLEAGLRDASPPTVITVPLFHLAEVRGMDTGDAALVEVAFVPSSESLVELASLDPGVRVTVASRRARGVDRLASVVRQYSTGEVEERLLGDEEADFSDVDVLVYNNGSLVRASELATARRTVELAVQLDSRSATTLRGRIEEALNQLADAGRRGALSSSA